MSLKFEYFVKLSWRGVKYVYQASDIHIEKSFHKALRISFILLGKCIFMNTNGHMHVNMPLQIAVN